MILGSITQFGLTCINIQFLWNCPIIGACIIKAPISTLFSLCRCTQLSRDSPCRTITGRNSNYSFPQNVPGLFIDPRSIRLTFTIINTLSPPPPPACTDAFLHLACGASVPPCDPSTQRILPYCNDSCRAYKQLLSDGSCDGLDAFLRDFVAASPVTNLGEYIDLYFRFDCDNTSTYLFGSHLDLVSQNKCTSVLSASFQGEDARL